MEGEIMREIDDRWEDNDNQQFKIQVWKEKLGGKLMIVGRVTEIDNSKFRYGGRNYEVN